MQVLNTMNVEISDHVKESEVVTQSHLTNLYHCVETLNQKSLDMANQIGRYPDYFSNFTSWTGELIEGIQSVTRQLRHDCEQESVVVHEKLAKVQQSLTMIGDQVSHLSGINASCVNGNQIEMSNQICENILQEYRHTCMIWNLLSKNN